MSSAHALSSNATIDELLSRTEVSAAFDYFDKHLDAFTGEQIRISEIPAPPFAEEQRAQYLKHKFEQLGLEDVHLDEIGNCLGLRKGRALEPLVVVSAHIDTVFPAETDCTVRKAGEKLFGPGISDDCCGLIALLAIGEALREANIETEGSILFVGTVGEEGEGNLRGVRHLLTKGKWANRVSAFLSFDGAEIDRITNGALGSRRYRVVFRGTGGHSWGDFGVANAVHALGRAITKLASYPAPQEPRTTFNVGHVEGGSSINAIPEEASMDVDLRSAEAQELVKLDAYFRRAMREAAEDENLARRGGEQPLALQVELLGERPSGETPADNALVKLALAATEAVGCTATLNLASTDSNLPISLGIPAITVGGGGTSGSAHTLDEWYLPAGRELALKRGLLVVLGAAGFHAVS